MLVDHAEAEPAGILRVGDANLAAVDEEAALVGPIVAEETFDERGLSRAVLAEQRMDRTGTNLQRDVVERGEGAEAFRDVFRFDPDGAHRHAHTPSAHDRQLTGGRLSATVPAARTPS